MLERCNQRNMNKAVYSPSALMLPDTARRTEKLWGWLNVIEQLANHRGTC